jgi:dipeptidyl aminopeptidase/acylaminoacyl peptidase
VCGTRFARTAAAEFGGDPNNLVVVGFSYGGLPGAAMAVTADYDFDCFAGTSHIPQAFIGLGGAYYYDWDIQALWGDIDASHFTTSGNAGDGVDVPITLIHGVGDANVPIDHAERHFRILDEAGETVGLNVLDTRHAELVRPDDAAGQEAIATILAATNGEHEVGQQGVSTVGASPWARKAGA